MTVLNIVSMLLKLAAYLARRAERTDIEKAITNEIEKIHGKRVDRAVDARGDVLNGRVPVDDTDPFKRD